MYKILTLNNISPVGLNCLPKGRFEVASEFSNPDAILVRSAKMHDMPIGSKLRAVARAGAGVNNIPVSKMSTHGIPVFNAPGANANAVKELTVAGLLMAARNIPQAYEYTKGLTLNGAALDKAVEDGKKKYAGYELSSKTLGVIGLGAIGVEVANIAVSLGMRVIGFDPVLTVSSAWKLNAQVERALSVDALLSQVDMVTFHVPLIDATRNLINTDRLKTLRDGSVILNFARGGIVCEQSIAKGIESGKISCYVSDFPSAELKEHPQVIALPHLGASTAEAEDNCAVMVANQLDNFLRCGNIVNSVNFPETVMEEKEGLTRLGVAHDNVPGMLEKVSHQMAESGLNIVDLVNKSRDDLAYTLIAFSGDCQADLAQSMMDIEGVRSANVCA